MVVLARATSSFAAWLAQFQIFERLAGFATFRAAGDPIFELARDQNPQASITNPTSRRGAHRGEDRRRKADPRLAVEVDRARHGAGVALVGLSLRGVDQAVDIVSSHVGGLARFLPRDSAVR